MVLTRKCQMIRCIVDAEQCYTCFHISCSIRSLFNVMLVRRRACGSLFCTSSWMAFGSTKLDMEIIVRGGHQSYGSCGRCRCRWLNCKVTCSLFFSSWFAINSARYSDLRLPRNPCFSCRVGSKHMRSPGCYFSAYTSVVIFCTALPLLSLHDSRNLHDTEPIST